MLLLQPAGEVNPRIQESIELARSFWSYRTAALIQWPLTATAFVRQENR